MTRDDKVIVDPTATSSTLTEPYFAVYDDSFLDVLGDHPEICLQVEKDYAFAHEACVFCPDQDAVFITSNGLKTEAGNVIKVGKLVRDGSSQWRYEEIQCDISMGNGGVNYRGGVLFCDQGDKTHPGGLVLMESVAPYKTTLLASGYHNRIFNSLNDVVVHSDGTIWFTDPIYGFEQGFRHRPRLPCQLYSLDPVSGDIRVVADGFGRPNGLCFSRDEATLYVTDTDWIHGDGTTDDMRPSSIYAFDVLDRHGTKFLTNRRMFAMADEGMPDGIKCDLKGNVYSGCGDGVNVWNAGGRLIGKIKIPGGIANFCFGRVGEIFLLNETRFWVVNVSRTVQGALLSNMGIAV